MIAAETSLGRSVAERFRLDAAPTILAAGGFPHAVALSRVRHTGAYKGESVASTPEEAFVLQTAVHAVTEAGVRMHGIMRPVGPIAPGDAFLFDMTGSVSADIKPPFDFVRFHLPLRTLQAFAEERGLKRVSGLRQTQFGGQDLVLKGLATAVLPALSTPFPRSALFLDSVGVALQAHVLNAYGEAPINEQKGRYALTGWQMRRVEAFAAANIGNNPGVADFARECRISASHFSRAFAKTMGMPPHRWFMLKRIEHAKALILDGERDFSQIALDCGFFDQSHLSKVFKRFEGSGPAQWRRLRCN